ncbi:MAG: fluoride efflux transporter CrcB [Desulfatitalea sp.]|nr:fluoride efflux transporter CrcB [Desulfatitalea sp.]NNK02307.1 fluoride efflux transporter CrcB [Desulfatitalea sp.]
MQQLLLVGIGGFAGALLRYAVSGWAQNVSRSIDFPYGTLAVNVVGCFFIGALSQLIDIQAGISAHLRLLLMVGLLGSFTTYSTFGNETFALLRDRQVVLALVNVCAHLFFGLSAVLLGRLTVFAIWR